MTTFTDESLQSVVFNKISGEQYAQLCKDETINDDEFYLIAADDPYLVHYRPPLFTTLWSDHILNDLSWLRADNFSWCVGSVFSKAYNKLLEEYNNEGCVEQTENGITYKLSPNGFKICDASQNNNVENLFLETGIAWYYIIDTENKQFKLPRTKYGFTGLRNNAGNSLDLGYTSTNGNTNIKSTEMHLYFYVGIYLKETAEEIAGINSELFNNKANMSDIPTITYWD